MPTLHRDIETRSVLRLADVGAWRYAADPSTEMLCIGYAIDDGPAQIWTSEQPIPEEFYTAACDPDWLVAAHNDQFESALEECLLGPRFGWPQISIARHRCTMAVALANALPGALDKAAAALGLPVRKDTEGRRLMMQMSRPRRPRKGEDPNVVRWHYDAERHLRLQEYCRRDVEVERELYQRLPPLPDDEQKLWQLDALINRRGFHVDLELAEATRKITRLEQAAINAEIAELTDGRITSVNQVGKLQALLQERGHKVTSLAKRSVSAVLAHEPADNIRRLLELRQEGAQAAARKLDSLIAGIDADQRLRGTFRYCGASTGRWSGARFQPQNLKKPQTGDINAAIEAIHTGDLEQVRAVGAPLAVAGDVSRSMIRAAPGRVLIGADFSAIESRVLAWLAGEEWKLDTYRKFDATNDPAIEPYCATASRILDRRVTPEDEARRQIGKLCDLAFGYGGGLGAFRRIAPDSDFTEAQIENFKQQWRAAHPAICAYWRGLHNALRLSLTSGRPMKFMNLSAEMRAGDLYLTLPSGRRLVYPEARLEPAKFGPQIAFKDNARGGWSDARGWHGTFTENVAQAISRDLLAAAMVRLEAAGYPVVLHCHDEVVCEVPQGFGGIKHFLELMTALPPWAVGLTLAAKAWSRERYAKLTPPSSAATPLNPKTSAPKANGFHSLVEPIAESIVVPLPPTEERTQIPLPDLIGEPLRDGKINCPFHADDTPSLHVYADHFHCFGCGAHGDHVDWLMLVEGKNRDQAVRALESWDGPIARPRSAEEDEEEKRRRALQLWQEARPIAGTTAIRYLAEVRGINADALPNDALRFHPRCPFGPGVRVPCLVALYRDVETDDPAGIHRIALTDDVFAGAKVQRRTLGSWPRPRAVKLWPAGDQLYLGEGIETVLAAATRLQHNGAPMRPAWAAGSNAGLGKLPLVPGVERLVVLVDHDLNGVGQAAAARCAERWSRAGRTAVKLLPKRPGSDFNDVAREKTA